MQTVSAPPRALMVAAFAAVYLIWGSTYLAIRFAVETLPPFLMAGMRFLVAGGLLYAWVRLRGEARPTRREWRAAAVVGALLLVGGNGLVVWSQQWVPSGVAALLVATMPFWMVLLEWVRPGGTRPGVRVVAGVIVGFVGIALLIGPEQILSRAWTGRSIPGGVVAEGVPLFGIGALLAASLLWATGSLYSRSAALPRSPLLATAMEMLAGGALLLVLGTVLGEWAVADPTAASARSLVAFAYLTVFGSLVGFTAYVWLLRVAAPAHVATYAYVNPVIAVLLGWAVAGEVLNARIGLAVAVIVGAVALITTRRARRVARQPAS